MALRPSAIEVVRITAFAAVARGSDPDYQVRRILRWYSSTFNTPLPVVEELPLDDVLQHYFEVQFEEMRQGNEQGLDEERRLLVRTPEEVAADERAGDVAQADADAFATQVARQQAVAAAQPEPPKMTIVPLESLPPSISFRFPGDDEDPFLGPNLHRGPSGSDGGNSS